MEWRLYPIELRYDAIELIQDPIKWKYDPIEWKYNPIEIRYDPIAFLSWLPLHKYKSNLHNENTWTSLEWEKIFQKGKHYFSDLFKLFWFHRHFNHYTSLSQEDILYQQHLPVWFLPNQIHEKILAVVATSNWYIEAAPVTGNIDHQVDRG